MKSVADLYQITDSEVQELGRRSAEEDDPDGYWHRTATFVRSVRSLSYQTLNHKQRNWLTEILEKLRPPWEIR
ncbi:MAG: hypothetical protein ACE5HV_11850 [Acidobacteriota bacterium]